MLRMAALCASLLLLAALEVTAITNSTDSKVRFETVRLGGEPAATVDLAYRKGVVDKHPVILMLGSLEKGKLPDWAEGLVDEGYMLCAYWVAHPQDPDERRRPVWLYFDARFAHSYAIGGYRAARDTPRIIDYLVSRGDVDRAKIGWFGSSSTGIPGLSVVTQGPRLAAIVAFVSTGAYRQWFDTWVPNGLWRDEKSKELWPDTEELLRKYDPIDHVNRMYPTAVLMVSGSEDKVVDPKTARAFVARARPYYANDPERLRLVIYDGFGHNLPRDIIRMYAENWFRLYMHPTKPVPTPPAPPKDLNDSVKGTQINAADHKKVVGAE